MKFFWEPQRIEEDTLRYWSINSARIWVRKKDDEWQIATELQKLGEPDDMFELPPSDPQQPSDNLVWKRFVATSESNEILFTPLTPDKPVVANPETDIQILPRHRALFFIRLPLWLDISVLSRGSMRLMEIPTTVLSNTWFGSPQDGILCYSLETRASRSFQATDGPLYINTPILIKNSSDKALDVQDVCIHGEHLKVFQGRTCLWTNEVHINYLGERQPSKISYSEKRPSYEEMEKFITGPREKLRQDLLFRSFSFLKNFT